MSPSQRMLLAVVVIGGAPRSGLDAFRRGWRLNEPGTRVLREGVAIGRGS